VLLRLLEESKRKNSEAIKELYKNGDTYKNTPCSEETKKKISEAKKGCKPTQETIDKQIAGRAGYTHSEETKKKISEAQKGISRVRTEAQKEASNKYQKIKVDCPHCDKNGSHAIMQRWHFDNCKHKPMEGL